ncbi:MAG TPA: heavy metal-binding domain-containing protein, partial [Syntrophales bacterium]|nr:heavy metal-binding domain-containing protein [Syntrophales bacterium]
MKTRTRSIVLGALVVAAAVLIAACKGNKGTGPVAGSAGGTLAQAEKAKPGAEKELYHCPMHPTYTSDKPGDCPICGMKLVPVEQQEEPAAAKTPPAPKKKVMYRSTMNPSEVSDKPGKDSMGMDMVPFEVEESGTVTEVGGRIRVKISAERQQLIGIKTAVVRSQPIHRLIRAVGRVEY